VQDEPKGAVRADLRRLGQVFLPKRLKNTAGELPLKR